jgi:hypothetical protein
MKRWMFIIIIGILFIGFAIMSIILAQGLGYLKEIINDFMEFMKGLIP